MPIPLFDPAKSIATLQEELEAAFRRVLTSGTYILGEELRRFESEFASYLGVREVVGVANGTDAITLSLLALGVGPGDDVIVPSFTFYASAEAIVQTGARPVFCDVDVDTFCVTADAVHAALTPRTKAIVAVDLFGNPIPIDDLERLGLPIVEDAAQAAGSRLGSRAAGALGTVGTFSFYPSKNLGCLGDGGAVATDDPELASRLRILRSHGSRDRTTYEFVGFNSRLDEMQAAVLWVFLRRLDRWADARRAADRAYRDLGLGDHVTLPVPVADSAPAWHLYVVRHPRPEAIASALSAAEIGNRSYYRTPIHLQPAMRAYAENVYLPATEELARTNLAIPIGATLEHAQLEEVVATVASGVKSDVVTL
jgi:dTDP-4-amino-4,6-dideoxygalactose transaminase